MRNRFNVLNVITLTIYVIFLSYMFWPVCQGNICISIMANGQSGSDPMSIFILLPLFLIPMFFSIYGVYKYMRGFGQSRKSETLIPNAKKEEKLYLLYSSLPGLIAGAWLTFLIFWSYSVITR